MKTSKTVVCMVWMLFGLCAGAMAQKNIDKVVADMEKNPDTRITSIKKRDPDTRKVVKVTKTVRLTDVQIAKRALEAFEKDEEDALTSIKEKRSRVEYTLTYRNKNEKRTYILTIREGNDVEISVFITPANDKDTGWTDKDALQYEIDMSRYAVDMEKYKKDMAQYEVDMNRAAEEVKKYVNETIELHGNDVFINGKQMKKGTYQIDGRKIVVK